MWESPLQRRLHYPQMSGRQGRAATLLIPPDIQHAIILIVYVRQMHLFVSLWRNHHKLVGFPALFNPPPYFNPSTDPDCVESCDNEVSGWWKQEHAWYDIKTPDHSRDHPNR